MLYTLKSNGLLNKFIGHLHKKADILFPYYIIFYLNYFQKFQLILFFSLGLFFNYNNLCCTSLMLPIKTYVCTIFLRNYYLYCYFSVALVIVILILYHWKNLYYTTIIKLSIGPIVLAFIVSFLLLRSFLLYTFS